MPHFFESKIVLWSLLGVVVVVLGVLVAVQIRNIPQSTPQKTDVSVSTAKVTLKPTTMALEPGETKNATVTLSTEGTRIDSVSVRITVPLSGTGAPISVGQLQLSTGLIAQQAFACPVQKADFTGTVGTIEVSCTAPNGFSVANPVDFFTIPITATAAFVSQPLTFSFDTAGTKITRLGKETAAIPTGTMILTSRVSASTTATSSATPVPTVVPSPTATPAATLAPLPSLTPSPVATTAAVLPDSCNSVCQSNRECAAGFRCSAGKCRNARCAADESCGCDVVDVASKSGTTTLPQSGFHQTALYAVLGLLFIIGGTQLVLVFSGMAREEHN